MTCRRWATLLLFGAAVAGPVAGNWAVAEGSFQVRYFLPSVPWYSGLSADLSWRGELPQLQGSQLDTRLSVSGTERQSAQVTYSAGRTVLLAQYDRSESLYGSGTKSDQTALLFAQQGFDGGDDGLRQIGLTALYTAASTPDYRYRVLSADVTAAGQFTRSLGWTLAAGLTSNDSGQDTFTVGSLSGRVRAGVLNRWEGELPASLGVQASYTVTENRVAGVGEQPDTRTSLGSAGLNVNGNAALGSRETLSGNARVDTLGYGGDLAVSSTRLEGWTLGAGVNVSGLRPTAAPVAAPLPAIPADALSLAPAALVSTVSVSDPTFGWSASAALAPRPWGLRLAYSGSSGVYGAQSLDTEAVYQEGSLGVQAGGGVTFQRGLQVAPDGTQTSGTLPAYRATLGISASPAQASAAGDESLQVQARLSLGASPLLGPQGQPEYRPTGALSGSLTYTGGPLRLELNSNLAYAAYTLQQPWSGEFGLQALYTVSDDLQLNLSGRWRPAGSSPAQAGFGLRYRF